MVNFGNVIHIFDVEEEKSIRCERTFIPISMGVNSAKGTSRVASSHRMIAKLHMSAARWSHVSGELFNTEGKRFFANQHQSS